MASSLAPRILVGLGNPADRYANTRHNVGREFIDYLAAETHNSYSKSRQSETFRLPAFFDSALDKPLICARLTCFMNESGPALKQLADYNGVAPEEILIIVDDFMIPFGSLRLRPKGSSGGHNGLKSIYQSFGTEEIPRLRVGIGPVPAPQDPADFVLKNFSRIETAHLPSIFKAVADGIKSIYESGFDRAMNQINKDHLQA